MLGVRVRYRVSSSSSSSSRSNSIRVRVRVRGRLILPFLLIRIIIDVAYDTVLDNTCINILRSVSSGIGTVSILNASYLADV